MHLLLGFHLENITNPNYELSGKYVIHNHQAFPILLQAFPVIRETLWCVCSQGDPLLNPFWLHKTRNGCCIASLNVWIGVKLSGLKWLCKELTNDADLAVWIHKLLKARAITFPWQRGRSRDLTSAEKSSYTASYCFLLSSAVYAFHLFMVGSDIWFWIIWYY